MVRVQPVIIIWPFHVRWPWERPLPSSIIHIQKKQSSVKKTSLSNAFLISMDDYGSPHLEISINLSADLSVPCQKTVRNVLPLSSSIYLFIYFSGAHMFKIFSCHNVVKNETCLFLMLMISCLCTFQKIYITYFGIQSIFKDQSHLSGMMGYFLLACVWAWW